MGQGKGRVLPRECTSHSKHHLSKTQEKTLHMDFTRWSTSKSDWFYSLQPKIEKLYTVSINIVTLGSGPAFQRATLLSFPLGHMLARDTAWAQRSLLISDVTSPWLTPACIGNWDRRGGRRKGEEDTDIWGRRLQSSVLGHRFMRPCLTHCAQSQQLKCVGCSSSFMWQRRYCGWCL